MKLTPRFIKKLNDHSNSYILWFRKSNTYSIVSSEVLNLLEAFLSKTKIDFYSYLKSQNVSINKCITYYREIQSWLNKVNTQEKDQDDILEEESLETLRLQDSKPITSYYEIYNKCIKINCCDNKIDSLINQQFGCYLTIYLKRTEYQEIDILRNENKLLLYVNKVLITSCKANENYVLLGKLSLQIISLIYGKKENDWLATFHASTVVKNNKAIMCIGASGSGKSTLCTILSKSGYTIIADDITPMLYKPLKVYRNPSSISIKKGAFEVLEPFVDTISFVKSVDTYKGSIKYLPISDNLNSSHDSFKCNTIVVVNFEKNTKNAELEVLSKSQGLEILIVESWINNHPNKASQFLKWIQTVTFFKLTYSKTQDAIRCFSEIESHTV